jgi:four helix bundle protein
MNEKQFRFQDLDVWRKAAGFSGHLFQIADDLENRRLYRFAEQLRAATLSITNNIVEGSGSNSKADFASFLNTSRRSVFEVANILLILADNGYLKTAETVKPLQELEEESRMLRAFIQTLKS